MITESYWNSQPCSLEVSFHGDYISGIQVRYIALAGWQEPFIPQRWCCFEASIIFRSSMKCPEEDHQPLMGKQFWNHLKSVSVCVTRIFVRYWFRCPSGTGAPRNDLDLVHELFLYPDKDVAKAATTAFDCHMWYLSEHLIASAFFDEKVSHGKWLVVAALRQNVGSEDPLNRIHPSKELHSLHTLLLIFHPPIF